MVEPTWHRKQRRERNKARATLKKHCKLPSALGARRKAKWAIGVLRHHHTWNADEYKSWINDLALAMDWQCSKCQIRVSIQKEVCPKCKEHWSKVWKKPRSRPRSESNRRKSVEGSEEVKDPDTELALFANKVPWVATTPRTRVTQMTESPPKAEVVNIGENKEEETNVAQSMQPTSEKQDSQMLSHLKSLKTMMGSLPEELEQKLQALEAVAPKLNHGHLNRMSKVQRQIVTTQEKLQKLDADWNAFVAQVEERYQKHKTLFLETRAQLLQTKKQKIAELEQIKEDIARASHSLMNTVVDLETDEFDFNDSGLLESLQAVVEPMETEEDGYEEQATPLEGAGDAQPARAAAAVKPFARRVQATSPEKVAKDHLKCKAKT